MTFAGATSSHPVPWVDAAHGPRLDGCVAYVACEPWQQYDGGDHVLILGEVTSIESRPAPPLIFHRGAFDLTPEREPAQAAG